MVKPKPRLPSKSAKSNIVNGIQEKRWALSRIGRGRREQRNKERAKHLFSEIGSPGGCLCPFPPASPFFFHIALETAFLPPLKDVGIESAAFVSDTLFPICGEVARTSYWLVKTSYWLVRTSYWLAVLQFSDDLLLVSENLLLVSDNLVLVSENLLLVNENLLLASENLVLVVKNLSLVSGAPGQCPSLVTSKGVSELILLP